MTRKPSQIGMNQLLHGDVIRRVERDGKTYFAAVDVVAALADSDRPAEFWAELKRHEPALGRVVESAEIAGEDGQTVAVDVVDLAGLMRLVQSIPSARAERLKGWLARTAVERLEEAENPELAVARTRKLYEAKGYSRRWVDKRLRGVSARHELTGEWYKRGAKESDQFRALTNAIMHGGFGMDVEAYRRHKNLFKTGENLRDHMSDLELALTALGETAAVALHRDRDSQSFEQLEADARDAGEIVARTRAEIENRLGHSVVEAANHRGWWAGRRRSSSAVKPGGDAPVAADAPEAPTTNETSDKAVA